MFSRKDPVGVFELADGSYEFEIQEPGFYSIVIVGAGYVKQRKEVTITLTLNNTEEIEVKVVIFKIRSMINGKISTSYWKFKTEETGKAILTLSNTGSLRVRESMLMSRRAFEEPITHSKLKLHVKKRIFLL